MEPFGDTLRLLIERGVTPEVLLPCVPHRRDLIKQLSRNWPLPPHILEAEDDKFRAFKLAQRRARRVRHRDAGTRARRHADGGGVSRRPGRRAVPAPHDQGADNGARQPRAGRERVPGIPSGKSSPENLAAALLPLLSASPERDAQLAALARIPGLDAHRGRPPQRGRGRDRPRLCAQTKARGVTSPRALDFNIRSRDLRISPRPSGNRGAAGRCRAGADGRCAAPDPRSFPSTARSSRPCARPRTAR